MSRRCKDKKDGKKEVTKIKNLKAKNICVQHLNAKDVDINIADINSAVINSADITNLDVQNFSLGGRDLTCILIAPAVTQIRNSFVLFGVTGATGPREVNPTVYNCLLQNAINEGVALKERIEDGRSRIIDYLAHFPCPPTCPPPVTDVPLDIYGTLTIPIYRRVFCGTTGPTGTTGAYNDFLNTAVNFNLEVTYLLEEAMSIDARAVSVLVQIGYIDPLGATGGCTGSTENVVIEEVFFANRQLYPTLDTKYGENFANIIDIPTDLSLIAYTNSPNPNLQGAIQMVIYKEKGLHIFSPNSEFLDASVNLAPAGSSEQVAPSCPPGQRLCLEASGLFPIPQCDFCNCHRPVNPDQAC
jgi:hypothetical protein